MGLFKVEVFSRVVDFVVKSGYLDSGFLVILRPSLFSRQSALQHFQPTLQLFKKLRRFYKNTITDCQEFFQSYIYPNGVSVWDGVRNADITLQGDRCVPFVCFPQDAYLLDREPCGNGSMQVDRYCSYFGQLNMQVCYWILFELRKQQRLELPKFLESGKAKSSILKEFSANVRLFNSLLEKLRRNLTQLGELLFSFWQVVKLLNFFREVQFRREDVLFFQRASIYQALATIAPIFYRPECVVILSSTYSHRLNKLVFLSGIWIDSVAVSDYPYSSIILSLLVTMQALNVKREGIEPPLLNDVSPTTKLSGVLTLRLDITPSSYSGGLLGELDKLLKPQSQIPLISACHEF